MKNRATVALLPTHLPTCLWQNALARMHNNCHGIFGAQSMQFLNLGLCTIPGLSEMRVSALPLLSQQRLGVPHALSRLLFDQLVERRRLRELLRSQLLLPACRSAFSSTSISSCGSHRTRRGAAVVALVWICSVFLPACARAPRRLLLQQLESVVAPAFYLRADKTV